MNPDDPESPTARGAPEDLCLAFANTRWWRGTDAPADSLLAPADLLGWCGNAGGQGGEMLARTAAGWQAEPAQAEAALAQAIALREALYRIFFRTASGETALQADLAALNAALAEAPPRARLRADSAGWSWSLPVTGPEVPLLLAPVLWSAGDLLAGRRLARVRHCANERCLYLFLDDSKGGTRRWCDMSMCGNRAKAHRHYAKQRAAR